MDIKLSQWAKNNGTSYMQAYRAYQSGELSEAYKTANGQIFVKDTPPPPITNTTTAVKTFDFSEPKSASFADLSFGAASRFNQTAVQEPLGKYENLKNSYAPFTRGTGAINESNINIRDIIILAQKAYYGFSPVRLIINTITEFSASPIYFTGSNKKAVKFFENYLKQINFADFVEQFFLEFYRSDNCFIWRQDASWTDEDIQNLNKVLGSKISQKVLPARYIVLNPAEIQVTGSSSFTNASYLKSITDYELARLKDPKTEEDIKIVESLPPKVQQALKEKKIQVLLLPLDPSKLTGVFQKKMSYEPFAVPSLFPILADLEFKSELKRMDMQLTRTISNAILHIKVGFENKAGDYICSPKIIDSLTKIFENPTLSRVLVTDFTVDMQFVIPDFGDLLDPKKYEIVNKDIQEGLNNIVFGSGTDEKFSNTQTKVRVFVEKIRRARQAFLNNFLVPEIRRLSKIMGFKSYPEPHFEDLDIENEVEYSRMLTRLAELGLLTPAELFEATESGRLPTPEESLEAQAIFKEARDKGYYQPLTGGPADQKELAEIGADAKLEQLKATPGRPAGTKAPKKKSKADLYSQKALVDVVTNYHALNTKVEDFLKTKHSLANLNDEQKSIADWICEEIMANIDISKWNDEIMIQSYVNNPVENEHRLNELERIKAKYGFDNFTSCLLLNSSNSTNASQ